MSRPMTRRASLFAIGGESLCATTMGHLHGPGDRSVGWVHAAYALFRRRLQELQASSRQNVYGDCIVSLATVAHPYPPIMCSNRRSRNRRNNIDRRKAITNLINYSIKYLKSFGSHWREREDNLNPAANSSTLRMGSNYEFAN